MWVHWRGAARGIGEEAKIGKFSGGNNGRYHERLI